MKQETDFYSIGDFVIIKTDEGEEKIGKIEDIFIEDEDKLIRYNEYITVDSVKKIVKSKTDHISKNELIQTSNIEKEFYDNISQKLLILRYEDYLKQNLNKPNTNLYFSRQKLNNELKELLPKIEPCYKCNNVINPDNEYEICEECNTASHLSCFKSSINNNKLCPKCKYLKASTNNSNNNNNNNDLLGKKRSNTFYDNNLNKNTNVKNNNVSNLNTKIPNISNNLNSADEGYNNLPKENKEYLKNLQDILQNISNLEQKSMSAEHRIRRLVKDKLTLCLVSLYKTI